jgi:hypothetical protein
MVLNGRQMDSGTWTHDGMLSFRILRLFDLAPIMSGLNSSRGKTALVTSGGSLIFSAFSFADWRMRWLDAFLVSG